jgi:hypothetical protein
VQEENRMTGALMIVIIFEAVCVAFPNILLTVMMNYYPVDWLLIFITNFIGLFAYKLYKYEICSGIFISTNSALNIIIYGYKLPTFRYHLLRLFRSKDSQESNVTTFGGQKSV